MTAAVARQGKGGPVSPHRARLRVWRPHLTARLGLFILIAGLISGGVTLGFFYVIGTATL